MTKPKTQAQLDKATDQRLRKTYGITLAEYKKLCAVHNGNCWICGKPPGTKRLSVEHDHSWKKIKLSFEKGVAGYAWQASAVYNDLWFEGFGKTKAEARKQAQDRLKKASVRGVCCPWCNRGLRYYHDDPELLRNAARYIQEFKEGMMCNILSI